MVPPQVQSVARKPLSIGFEEIAADKIVRVELPDPETEADDDAVERRHRRLIPSATPDLRMLAGKRIVLGVTGGIAAYKAVEVCRRLVDAGAHVVPVMTKGAEHFLGRTTLSALASEPVQTSLWDEATPDPAHPARPVAPTSSWSRRPRPG